MGRIESKLDHLIELLINDARYSIERDGTIRNAKGEEVGYERDQRGKLYVHVTYGPERKKLKRNRIIYRKFHGPLEPGMVIHHLDDNSLNDHADNLSQVTQRQNMEAKKG